MINWDKGNQTSCSRASGDCLLRSGWNLFPCVLHNWLDAFETGRRLCLQELGQEARAKNAAGWDHVGNGLCGMNNPIIIWPYHFCFILRFSIPYVCISINHMMKSAACCVWNDLRLPTLANTGLSEWRKESAVPLGGSGSSSVDLQLKWASNKTVLIKGLHKNQSATQM